MSNTELLKKLGPITSQLLKKKGFISFADVFIKLGYLNQKDYENWRMKKVPYLERVIKINLKKISLIMKTVRKNSENVKLRASFTAYKSWGKGPKIDLRFSKTGDKNIERLYSTHYLKSKKKNNVKELKKETTEDSIQ